MPFAGSFLAFAHQTEHFAHASVVYLCKSSPFGHKSSVSARQKPIIDTTISLYLPIYYLFMDRILTSAHGFHAISEPPSPFARSTPTFAHSPSCFALSKTFNVSLSDSFANISNEFTLVICGINLNCRVYTSNAVGNNNCSLLTSLNPYKRSNTQQLITTISGMNTVPLEITNFR